MKNSYFISLSVGLSAILLVASCATNEPNPQLIQAKNRYSQEVSTAGTQRYAATDIANAKNELEAAEKLHKENAKPEIVEHRVWMANKYMDVVDARRDLGTTQQQIEDADVRRNRLLLMARERDLQVAQTQVQVAQNQAQVAQTQAERQAQLAKKQAQQAQQAKQRLQDTQRQLAEAQQRLNDMAGELKELQAQKTERGTVLTLSDIVFDLNSDKLKSGADRALNRVAAFLQDFEDRRVLVEGFTDSIGTDDYNRDLSQRRANSVRDALIDRGIEASRIAAVGYGERFPIASNDAATGRQQNRRVEIIIGEPGENVLQRAAVAASGEQR